MDYFDRPGISASMLKSMAQGWRQFEAEYITRSAQRVETPALALGTAIHAALLEPDKFRRDYITCPEECSDRRTKAYKEWAADAGDKIVLTQQDRTTIDRACDACYSNPTIHQLLRLEGTAETEVYWTDEETGVDCKAKIDKLYSQLILDVKTTEDARPQAFAKTIGTFRYDLQSVHYMQAANVDAFVFLAVEKSEPFRVRLYELCQTDLSDAREIRRELLVQYTGRMTAQDWREIGETEIQTLFLPSYLK